MIKAANVVKIEDGLKLTDQQAAAYDAATAFCTGAHGARMMTVEGYAGTGKTTIVGRLVRSQAKTLKIAVAAPTNKAVFVLHEKIASDDKMFHVEYGSIHSFLGLRLKERDDGTHECIPEGAPSIHEFDAVIVDECSMIGRDLFGRIVLAIARSDTRVLFVGDPAQLPPVEPGSNVKPSPTFGQVQHKAVLTEIVRQAAENPIIAVSMKIREAIELGLRMSPFDIANSLPEPPADALLATGGADTCLSWALHDIRAGSDTRILAFRNATVIAYNRAIHSAIHGNEKPFAPGEPVILNQAHDTKHPVTGLKVSLFNSEECEVLECDAQRHPNYPQIDSWHVLVRRDSGDESALWVAADPAAFNRTIGEMFTKAARLKSELAVMRDSAKDEERRSLIRTAWAMKNTFADLRHAYAMTVHKSQGSTFDTAIVDLDDIGRIRDPIDHNRALYVACTRPRNHLAFVA